MKFDPAIHKRRSIRLKGFDYKTPGAYFVTICAFERAMLFGEIVDDKMHVNSLGEMVHAVWFDMPKHYDGIHVDAFIVMPNHAHGIIWIAGAEPRTRPNSDPDVGAAPCGRPDGLRGDYSPSGGAGLGALTSDAPMATVRMAMMTPRDTRIGIL